MINAAIKATPKGTPKDIIKIDDEYAPILTNAACPKDS